MNLGIRGKPALVLASSQALDNASSLGQEGASALLSGRSADKLAAAAKEPNTRGAGSADFSVADLSTTEAATTLHAAAGDKSSGVDIPVNSTGNGLASVAAFLVSVPPGCVTGSILRCDGGQIRSL